MSVVSMLCIFCCQQRAPSLEHVFPLAIGGTVTTDRVCASCNSTLGSRVDSALTDFFPVRMRRAELSLSGNNGRPPAWYEMFLGEAELVGAVSNRVRTTFNEETGKLETRQLYHAEDVFTPDGKKSRRITLDERDVGQIPKIIQRERKRHGLPPLNEEELAAASANYTVNAVEQPCLKLSPSISFAYLRHAMIKIAYELAFLWLGEDYLLDSLANELREAICDEDIASTDRVAGSIGFAGQSAPFNQFWTPDQKHHLAYANIAADKAIVVCVRIFDIYEAVVEVSRDPKRYIGRNVDREKLRFLAIDSVSGKTVNTSFDEESRRLARAMSAYGRTPPFNDPLLPLAP